MTMTLTVPPLLRERSFRRYWSASTISMFGDQISGIALPLTAVLVLRAGPAQMGYLTALEWLPSLLFGLHLGALVDRIGHRRAMMITADLGRALVYGSIPVCYALHALTLPQLYSVMFAAGVLSVLFGVANGTLFVSVVPPDRYVDGQSLIYGSRALSFTGGPSIGGVLVQLLSGPVTVVFNAVSYLGSAYYLARIRPAEPPVEAAGKGATSAGARYLIHDPIVRSTLLAAAALNLFGFMWEAIVVLYAVRVLHIQPGVLGVLLGTGAAGGIVAAIVTKRIAARIGIGWALTVGCLLFAAPQILWPAAGGPHSLVLATLLVAELGCGFGVMMLDISIGAIFAAAVPDQLRSRVTGAFGAVNYGSRPIGAVLGGVLASQIGLRPAMWIATVGGLLGFLVVLPTPVPRYRMPAEPAT